MRRLAQFVRLRASHVSRRSSCLASACVCLACVLRLSASVHVKGSECVRLRLSRVCASARICLRRSSCLASVCVGRLVSRRSSCLASVVLSRVGRLVSRRSSCLASVVLSRVCLSPCECLRELAHFMRRSSFKEFFAIVILSLYI